MVADQMHAIWPALRRDGSRRIQGSGIGRWNSAAQLHAGTLANGAIRIRLELTLRRA